jgi:glycine/D-amino acid oxidase-like deaminating enzyme
VATSPGPGERPRLARAPGATHNGGVSFWFAADGIPDPRPTLTGDRTADVCIVGGGFTGLWTAYALKQAEPSMDVVLVERDFCGFGASGRNGGWLSAVVPGPRRRYAEAHGDDAVVRFQLAMRAAVDEVIATADRLGIEADIVKGGMLTVARNRAQHGRLVAHVDDEHRWGNEDVELLSSTEARRHLQVTGMLGASRWPQCARIQPARLVRGLAGAVEALGVSVTEATTVTGIDPGRITTDRGIVRARTVVRATEGFTAGLPGQHRTWLPMNSSMIVTEPLAGAVWEAIGWQGCEVVGDIAHAYLYAQRTADDRIAIGGRGVPYRYGSRTDTDGTTAERTVRSLWAMLGELFPVLGDVRVDHAWSGVLGVPRDWCASVGYDPRTGLGWAGGYTGDGVTTSNLAARTLCDLVLGRDTELVGLPWVDRRVRPWEPEPLRWLGVRSLYAAYRGADRLERRGGPRTSFVARIADAVSGRE